MIRSKKITRSAQGQPCFLSVPGICNHNPDTTVWAHLNGASFGKGSGIKAHDVAGFPACSNCHFAYDQHKTGLSDGDLNALLLRAVVGSMVMLIERGIIIAPLDIETGLMDRPVKPRKPKSQRAKIPSRKFGA
jgi:hypothetical protein